MFYKVFGSKKSLKKSEFYFGANIFRFFRFFRLFMAVGPWVSLGFFGAPRGPFAAPMGSLGAAFGRSGWRKPTRLCYPPPTPIPHHPYWPALNKRETFYSVRL